VKQYIKIVYIDKKSGEMLELKIPVSSFKMALAEQASVEMAEHKVLEAHYYHA